MPQWRLWLQTLNWRRDPGYEQRKIQHELRMKQLESEIEQSKERTKQIEKETEQLRRENARLAELNAKLDVILFSSATNSSPPPSTPHKPET